MRERKRTDLTAELLFKQMVADYVRHPSPYGATYEQGRMDSLSRMAGRVYVLDGHGRTAADIVGDEMQRVIERLSPEELAKISPRV